jgi:hypothetical protein
MASSFAAAILGGAGAAWWAQPLIRETDESPEEAEPRQQVQGQAEGQTPTAAHESVVETDG